MLNSIFEFGAFSLNTVLPAMGAALVLGLVVAGCYMLSGPYVRSFVVVLAVLPLLVECVIMIVNGNLGASVAVLGAFGLVRFRSVPGSAREIGFIFFAMAVGLATGLGFLTLAALLTAAAGAALVLLSRSGFGRGDERERELKITIPEDLSYHGAFDDLFQRFTLSHRLLRVRTTNMGTMYELAYQVVLRQSGEEKEFMDEIRSRNGNLTVSLGLVNSEKTVL
jgi:hypothetical protein